MLLNQRARITSRQAPIGKGGSTAAARMQSAAMLDKLSVQAACICGQPG